MIIARKDIRNGTETFFTGTGFSKDQHKAYPFSFRATCEAFIDLRLSHCGKPYYAFYIIEEDRYED